VLDRRYADRLAPRCEEKSIFATETFSHAVKNFQVCLIGRKSGTGVCRGPRRRTRIHGSHKVLFLYYTNDQTMKEIGDMIGVNESRVSQIHKTALKKMAVALETEGIRSAEAF
jgi:hypothetical protein